MATHSKSLWLASGRPKSRARLRLFCFPYVGGSEAIYRTWQQAMPPEIEVLPIQLPGRGVRMNEPPITRLDALVEILGRDLITEMELPFAIFGHSMGGLIAFELARWLRKEQRASPVHLFISAKSCPEEQYKLSGGQGSDAELIRILREYEGTPAEMLENAELMQLLLPVIRADIELCRSYIYRPTPPLSCPITVFGGLKDHARPRAALENWRNHTTSRFQLRMLPGGHLFIQAWERSIVETIAGELRQP